jgi:hypothetical protein
MRFHRPTAACSQPRTRGRQPNSRSMRCREVLLRKPPPKRRMNRFCTRCNGLSRQSLGRSAPRKSVGAHTSAQKPKTGDTRESMQVTCKSHASSPIRQATCAITFVGCMYGRRWSSVQRQRQRLRQCFRSSRSSRGVTVGAGPGRRPRGFPETSFMRCFQVRTTFSVNVLSCKAIMGHQYLGMLDFSHHQQIGWW